MMIYKITNILSQTLVDLENNKITHCDIKPENILISNKNTHLMINNILK